MTTPGFLGMDVGTMAALRTALTKAGTVIGEIRTAETALVDRTNWYGTDADTFRQSWHGTYAPALHTVGQALLQAAGSIGRQLQQQEQASSGGGAASSAAGPGGGPAGRTPAGTAHTAAAPTGLHQSPSGTAATHPANTATTGAGQTPAATPASGSPANTAPHPAGPDDNTSARPGGQPSNAPPSGADRTPSPATPAQQGSVHVPTPFFSQYAAGHGYQPGDTACFKAATAMAAQSGATVLGPADRIQIATSERADGSVVIDRSHAAAGQRYIDSELAAGRPVVVGVSYKDAAYNVDRITDHFVVVTGRGVDPSGNTYYTYNDPATRHASLGTDTRIENRFTVGPDGGLRRHMTSESAGLVNKDTWVSMVRRNAESRAR